MYKNLKDVLYQERISLKQYGDILGVTEKTVANKLKGITDYTYPEFLKTCALLSKYRADYLFAEYPDQQAS